MLGTPFDVLAAEAVLVLATFSLLAVLGADDGFDDLVGAAPPGGLPFMTVCFVVKYPRTLPFRVSATASPLSRAALRHNVT